MQENSRKEKLIKLGTAAVFAALLLVPALLKKTDGKNPLYGVTSQNAEKPEITLQGLMDGSFGEQLNTWLEGNLPGREFLIRSHNDLVFYGLHTSTNNSYSMNSGRNLFTWGNVNHSLQYTAPEEDAYFEKLGQDLGRLQEKLMEQGTGLYVFITPCKTRYYAQELPWYDTVLAPKLQEDNYSKLLKTLDDAGIRYFDSIRYIDGHRTEWDPEVPLFYRSNVHWSTYVGNQVAAGFGKYLAEETGFSLPEVEIRAVPTDTPEYPDGDALDIMNTMRTSYDSYHRPEITVTKEGKDSPSCFMRGGSFMGQTLAMLIRNGYFSDEVYFENVQLFTGCFSSLEQVTAYDQVDLHSLVDGKDLVILEVNEPSIRSMGFGFIEYYLEH